MTVKQGIGALKPIAAATVLLVAAPAALAQLAPGPGTGVAPHEDYRPCSACHVRFDQWGQAQFDIKKPTLDITSTAAVAAGFVALRDLQSDIGFALSPSGGGGGGQGPGGGQGGGKNVQIHPVAEVECTLCHAKFEDKHATIDMVIDEADPAASCQTSSCHKDTKKLAEMLAKIPYWTMAFVTLPRSVSGAETAVSGLVDRTQDAVALVPGDVLFEEGTWKHEVKGVAPIARPNLQGVAVLLQDQLLDLTTGLPTLAGELEGKVEAKTAVSNATLRTYPARFDRALQDIADLLKETKLESKYKPGHPAGAIDVFIALVEKRFPTAVQTSLSSEKVVYTLDGGEIVGEFNADETKLSFKNLSATNFRIAVNRVLTPLDTTYPETLIEEAKFSHAYVGKEDGRERVADAIKAFKSQLPDKELKYELKAKKDTETIPSVAELLPVKAVQHAGKLIKLKTEYKYKVGKVEPEVKAEAAAAAQ